MEKGPFEDIFLLKKGTFQLAMLVYRLKLTGGCRTRQRSWSINFLQVPLKKTAQIQVQRENLAVSGQPQIFLHGWWFIKYPIEVWVVFFFFFVCVCVCVLLGSLGID